MVEVYPSSYAYSGVATIPEDSPIDDVSRVAAAAVAARALMGGNYASRPENGKATREEHAAMMHELSKKRAGWRTPRRGWSSTDKPVDVPVDEQPRISPTQAPQATQHHHHHHHHAPIVRPPTEARTAVDARGPPRPRPAMPPPRRSYSVMDYEPPSATHRPSVRMTIADLPAELHFAVFDFLDPIDSTCLGLTNKHFYNIHRRMHGVVPLSSRREGPNDLEWAWRGAGPLVHPEAPPSEPALEKLRVKGQVYCRKCGISRCELHRHLKEWMMAGGRRYEYCAVTCKYGEPALDDAREFCYLKSPKKPHRCGRHAARAASGTQTPRAPEPQHKA